MRQQNDLYKNDKKTLIKDIEDLKNKLIQFEENKQNIKKNYDQWKKEKQILLKKIEIVIKK